MPAFTLHFGNTRHMLSLTLIYKSSTIQVNHNEIESLFHVWRVIKNGKTEKYTQESSHAGFHGEHPASNGQNLEQLSLCLCWIFFFPLTHYLK